MRHILVCEANDDLIRRMHGEAIVVKTNVAGEVGHFARVINESNKIHCIEYTSEEPLAYIELYEDWKGFPIHVMSPSLGKFMDFIVKRTALKELQVRCFLDASVRENYVDLQIMTSLGIPGGLWFKGNDIPWSDFKDIMAFTVFPKVYRADIEPFAFVMQNFKSDANILFPVKNFDNPYRYLHVDKDENVALTSEHLQRGEYLFQGLEQLDELDSSKAYLAWKKQAHRPFMKITDCGSCPGWRICGGQLAYTLADNPGCKKAMEELIEAAEIHQSTKTQESKGVELCQL